MDTDRPVWSTNTFGGRTLHHTSCSGSVLLVRKHPFQRGVWEWAVVDRGSDWVAIGFGEEQWCFLGLPESGSSWSCGEAKFISHAHDLRRVAAAA